ncbi:signal peptidase I [Desulfohalotomaculum tongense]|uniref:signal peptidase I n=1 Tax=Desulforadius tongensis TaxID=1216062 RepID=UPI001EE5DC10|nr:signal peptidase I [Desulforadius tongensis]MBM7854369.1 signal peptidase I [Desulforadius tongensis]
MESVDHEAKAVGQKNKKNPVREIIESVVIAVVLAVVIRMFIVEPFYIPSGSMEPTLMINDRIIVSKISYYFDEPKRGDIVVFKYPRDPSRNFVKRLIGEPGDTVELRDSKLYINGKLVPEDYLPAGIRYGNYGPVKVPAGHYLMLGDNRNNSEDSRYWGFLPENLIIGKAVLIYWPVNRLGLAG